MASHTGEDTKVTSLQGDVTRAMLDSIRTPTGQVPVKTAHHV